MNSPHSPEPLNAFESLITDALSRRDFVRMGLGSLAVGFFAAESSAEAAESLPFGFEGIPVSTNDEVKVPANYHPQVLYAWGDPVNGQGPAFKTDGTNTVDEQGRQAGMGHDGMQWFPWPGDEEGRSDRGLLVMNHEYTDPGLLFPDGLETMTLDKIHKSQAAHGVSVIAVEQQENGQWKVVPSKWTRRITANTGMKLTGPAAGSEHVKSKDDSNGVDVLGTFNNCASGKTPWGTYLTCEENVNGYFGTDASGIDISKDLIRYGFSSTGFTAKVGDVEKSLHHWWAHDPRFDLAKTPKEPNRFGYVVEIDPTDPTSVPHKHTALGRMKHENAAVTLSNDKRVVVYMGDDEKNEYIYKFVTKGSFNPENREANKKLLEDGTLYVARFLSGNQGEWIPLIHDQHELTEANGFKNQADISVRTRQAADRVHATMMDRPEWIAVHPRTGKVFVTLTNNDQRGGTPLSVNAKDGTTKAASAKPPKDDANTRETNVYGHIISWDEERSDAAATTFKWNIFLLAGDPTLDERVNIKGDPFGSPDGLTFDPRGILWIQTDVSTSKLGGKDYKNLGNNMMLAADPETGVVRRFLTGPRGCEITGLAFTPDLKTMFVNIQHPGEPSTEASDPKNPKAVSTWPDGQDGGRPRPATVAITHREGKMIGA